MIATSVYLKLNSEKLGLIKGSVIQKGKEGLIEVLALNHNVEMKLDLASGNASGKRQHYPIVITKEVDRTTPLLNQSLVTNGRFKETILTFYGPATNSPVSQGSENKLYTISLTNAIITSIHVILKPMDEFRNKPANFVEEVSFAYTQIDWKWESPLTQATDDWMIQK